MSQLPEFQPIVTREEFQSLAQSVTRRLESFQKLRVEDTDTCQDAFVRAERAVKRADEAAALAKKLAGDFDALVTVLSKAWPGKSVRGAIEQEVAMKPAAGPEPHVVASHGLRLRPAYADWESLSPSQRAFIRPSMVRRLEDAGYKEPGRWSFGLIAKTCLRLDAGIAKYKPA